MLKIIIELHEQLIGLIISDLKIYDFFTLLLGGVIIGIMKIQTKKGKVLLTVLSILWGILCWCLLYMICCLFLLKNPMGHEIEGAKNFSLIVTVIIVLISNLAIWVIPLKKDNSKQRFDE